MNPFLYKARWVNYWLLPNWMTERQMYYITPTFCELYSCKTDDIITLNQALQILALFCKILHIYENILPTLLTCLTKLWLSLWHHSKISHQSFTDFYDWDVARVVFLWNKRKNTFVYVTSTINGAWQPRRTSALS